MISGRQKSSRSLASPSSSRFVTETINRSHNFVIKGYSLAKGIGALLHFIYTDNLIEDEELSDASSLCMSSLSDGLAAKLLAASDKYGLPRVKLMCESVLCKIMSVNYVAIILALADRYRAMDLKSVCLKFATENLVGESFDTHGANFRDSTGESESSFDQDEGSRTHGSDFEDLIGENGSGCD
ncbi:hypothetical protein C1H46_020297 [Malus baccata]|uniref:Uncharacterized protein n=1 Tax=Malus baccata TaxID=106549 RepID=A0A540M6F3_MALBA|nr:hypothetical protein C1H46_020297 [Malus baccata]